MNRPRKCSQHRRWILIKLRYNCHYKISGLILRYGVKMADSKTATNAKWLTERSYKPLKMQELPLKMKKKSQHNCNKWATGRKINIRRLGCDALSNGKLLCWIWQRYSRSAWESEKNTHCRTTTGTTLLSCRPENNWNWRWMENQTKHTYTRMYEGNR